MPWNSTFPLGSVSVKSNKTIGQQNTTYIETTMGNSIVGTNTNTTRDHFWNVGATLDGRHRFIQSPAFTVGGSPADPVLGAGMDGVQYLKTVLGRVQGFYQNAQGIYQSIPAFLSGSVSVPSSSSYSTVVTVPANCYGQIFMYSTTLGNFSAVEGFFRSNGTVVEAWALIANSQGSGNNSSALKFGNGGEASGLDIKARANSGSTGTWNYRITYRAL